MNLNHAEQLELKSTLASVIACEFRACLYESLIKEVGKGRSIALLANAERTALNSIKGIHLSKLV